MPTELNCWLTNRQLLQGHHFLLFTHCSLLATADCFFNKIFGLVLLFPCFVSLYTSILCIYIWATAFALVLYNFHLYHTLKFPFPWYLLDTVTFCLCILATPFVLYNFHIKRFLWMKKKISYSKFVLIYILCKSAFPLILNWAQWLFFFTEHLPKMATCSS